MALAVLPARPRGRGVAAFVAATALTATVALTALPLPALSLATLAVLIALPALAVLPLLPAAASWSRCTDRRPDKPRRGDRCGERQYGPCPRVHASSEK